MDSKITYLKKADLFKEWENLPKEKFFAVIDRKVQSHLPSWVASSPSIYWLDDPEESKNLDMFGKISQCMLEKGIERSSHIYAVGGGATTDLAGFVAATILRGVKWKAVPTTLLGMVDASIGGKVGVNVPQGKNLVGAFHLPEDIFLCTEFLSTLPEEELLSGKGEIVKYGFLSQDIHRLIMQKALLEDIILACARYKKEVTERDFRETGERIFLNLGHTLGHAFESTLKIPHGKAVLMGMKYLFKTFKQKENLQEWDKMLLALGCSPESFNLSAFSNFEFKTFLNHLQVDKKRVSGKIRVVLVKAIGSCETKEVTLNELKEKWESDEEFVH